MQWADLLLPRSCNRISNTPEEFHQAVRRITQVLPPLSDLSNLLWRRSPSRPARISSLALGRCHLPQPSIMAATCQTYQPPQLASRLAAPDPPHYVAATRSQRLWSEPFMAARSPSPLVQLSPPRTEHTHTMSLSTPLRWTPPDPFSVSLTYPAPPFEAWTSTGLLPSGPWAYPPGYQTKWPLNLRTNLNPLN